MRIFIRFLAPALLLAALALSPAAHAEVPAADIPAQSYGMPEEARDALSAAAGDKSQGLPAYLQSLAESAAALAGQSGAPRTSGTSGGTSGGSARVSPYAQSSRDPLYALFEKTMQGSIDASMLPQYFEADLAALEDFLLTLDPPATERDDLHARDVLEALLTDGTFTRENNIPALDLENFDGLTLRYHYTMGRFSLV